MRVFAISLLSLLPLVAFGADATPGTYKLMAPIGAMADVSLTAYLTGVVQFIIGIAGILAVIMIVWCGVKLIGSPSASGKAEAKECIQNAILGVLLAIGAWALLFTINPLLLSNELNLLDVARTPTSVALPPGERADQPVPKQRGWYFKKSGPPVTYNSGGATKQTCDALVKQAADADAAGCFFVDGPKYVTSGDEEAVRRQLCGDENYEKKNKCVNTTPIGINNLPCSYVGQRGCTNVAGLLGQVITVVQTLSDACGCSVLITGGTEWWSHKTHGSANSQVPVVDIHSGPGVTKFLWKEGKGLRASFGGWKRVYYEGFWWTYEGNGGKGTHWHACAAGQSQFYCKSCVDPECKKPLVEPE